MRDGSAALLGLALLGVLVCGTHAQEPTPSAYRGGSPVTDDVEDLGPPSILILPTWEIDPIPAKRWTGGVEFGVNGAEGNSEIFKMRLAGNVKRFTYESILTAEVLYNITTAAKELRENRLLSKARHEWPFPDSPWSMFVSTSAEYDEFKAFDVRLASHAGVGYDFWNTPRSMFKGRIGAGTSRELGGRANHFMPEGLVGFDWDQRISKRQKIKASIEYFPDLGDFGDFRSEARVAYEILIDPDLNLTLKIGVLDRYDSTPEGKEPNDLEYFAVLLWKF